MKEVRDDEGGVFPRGMRVLTPASVWSLLKSGPAAESFVFFSGQPAAKCGAPSN